jgi:osmotically-inducible protein OsmY
MKIGGDMQNDFADPLKCTTLGMNMPVAASPDDLMTDADILRAVLNSLKWNTTIRNGQITITVEDGNVTLEGEVEWEYQRVQAKSAIEKMAAVRSVANVITIKPICSPSDIQHEINTAFQRSATADAGKITAEVLGTKVILHGVVRSFAEKEDAENAAWSVPGVMSVESSLEIAEPAIDNEEPELGQYSNYPD